MTQEFAIIRKLNAKQEDYPTKLLRNSRNPDDIRITLFSLFIKPSLHIPSAIVRGYSHPAQPKRDVHNRICGC